MVRTVPTSAFDAAKRAVEALLLQEARLRSELAAVHAQLRVAKRNLHQAISVENAGSMMTSL